MKRIFFRVATTLLVAAAATSGCARTEAPYRAVHPCKKATLAYEQAPTGAVAAARGEPTGEAYERPPEQPFATTQSRPVSTVSVDVDTASLSNTRRFVEQQHKLPPPQAVRIEEWVNAFDYGLAVPTEGRPFAVHTEVTDAPWRPGHKLARISLQSRRVSQEALPPMNLVFLLDTSGSMQAPNKLPLVQASLRMLVRRLRAQDRVAIVTYAGSAGLVLPATTGDRKKAILAAIDRLQAGGSTAGAAGIQLAYQVARAGARRGVNSRVILATDGDFNVGMSSDASLVRLIETQRDAGVFLTVLGFGAGNYKDSKMQKLADHGDGQHAYIDGLREAHKVLARQMGSTLLTVAKDVKVQVEFNPERVASWRLIGYDNRRMAARDFDDDRKDAGELGAGHSVTWLYEFVPKPSVARRGLRYHGNRGQDGSQEWCFVKLRHKAPTGGASTLQTSPVSDRAVPFAQASESTRFAAAVAEAGLVLSQSEHAGRATLASAMERASDALGTDLHGDRAAFVDLLRRARALSR